MELVSLFLDKSGTRKELHAPWSALSTEHGGELSRTRSYTPKEAHSEVLCNIHQVLTNCLSMGRLPMDDFCGMMTTILKSESRPNNLWSRST